MVYVQKELLELGQELGQGEFGSVLMGTYRLPEGGSVSNTTVLVAEVHIMLKFEWSYTAPNELLSTLNLLILFRLM